MANYDQMMASITERQFRTWWAYHLFVEPLESQRMDRRFGLLVACLESLLYGEDAGYNPANFSLGWRESCRDAGAQPAGEDWQLMKARLGQIIQEHTGVT